MADTKTSVESKIRSIIEDQWQPDADYQFYNWAQANVELDGMKRPVIVFILPASGYIKKQWYQFTDRPNAQIAFLANTEFDFDSVENDALMQSMKELAMNFILQVNKSGMFEKIPNDALVPYQVVYDYLDQNVTGIVITLDLKEVSGVSICDTSE